LATDEVGGESGGAATDPEGVGGVPVSFCGREAIDELFAGGNGNVVGGVEAAGPDGSTAFGDADPAAAEALFVCGTADGGLVVTA